MVEFDIKVKRVNPPYSGAMVYIKREYLDAISKDNEMVLHITAELKPKVIENGLIQEEGC